MEAPPLKTLIVVVVFLGIFTTLTTVGMSSGLISGGYDPGTSRQIVEDFEVFDVWNVSSTHLITPNADPYSEQWGETQFGHTMSFYSTSDGGAHDGKIQNNHYSKFLFWDWQRHSMDWINRTGYNRGGWLTVGEMEVDLINNGTNVYKVTCDHFFMMCVVGYNVSAYDNATHAFANNGLNYEFGIAWDQQGTGMNAFSLLANLLFFNMPDIHYSINAIIALPIWVCIAYLTFAFVMAVIKTLPFT